MCHHHHHLSLPLIFILLLLAQRGTALDCYRNDGLTLETGVEHCHPQQQRFCLKALAYDGRVIRDCARMSSCPQVLSCFGAI
jgi:hypothetical protein